MKLGYIFPEDFNDNRLPVLIGVEPIDWFNELPSLMAAGFPFGNSLASVRFNVLETLKTYLLSGG